MKLLDEAPANADCTGVWSIGVDSIMDFAVAGILRAGRMRIYGPGSNGVMCEIWASVTKLRANLDYGCRRLECSP